MTMLKKLIKVPPVKVVAAVKDTEYVILSDGTVARRNKPVVVNGLKYWNFKIDGRLVRIAGSKLMENSNGL